MLPKNSRYSYVTLILFRRHLSAITYLEEHRALLLEPTIYHHEVLSTKTCDKPSNFDQALKEPDQINLITAAYAQYDKNSAFVLVNAPLFRTKLPSTTCILQSVLDPIIKNISNTIYQYCPRHCDNGGPQVTGIDLH